MAGRIGFVHAAEVRPISPGARRRAWVDALFAALLTRAGSVEVVPVAGETCAVGEPADAPADRDGLALHLHSRMAKPVQQVIDGYLERADGRRLIVFGDVFADPAEAARLARQGHVVFRGLPSPTWALEIARLLESGRQPGDRAVVEPMLPSWDDLPGGAFKDPRAATTLLLRTALGVTTYAVGSGLTAFEGPRRERAVGSVIEEVGCAGGGDLVRAEIVDAVPCRDIGGEGSNLLAVLRCCPPGVKWTLPVTAVSDGDPGFWRSLHEAGVDTVRAGLPSGCARLCDSLHDANRPDVVGRALEAASASGIATELSLHVGAPGETGEDRRLTAAWLRRHAGAIGVLVLRAYSPDPGSEMMLDPERHGIWWPPGGDRGEWADRAGNNAVSRSKHLSELVEVARGSGIEVEAPGLTIMPDVRRHRSRIVTRFNVAEVEAARDPKSRSERRPPDNEGAEVVAGPEATRGPATGPRMVEIELSAACNLRCIGCWCHSGLLSSDRHRELQTARPLRTSRINELLDEIAGLGVREVQFSGSGEPLVNADAVQIIGRASSLGLRTTLVTNGTLLDASRVEALGDAGLDQATVSVWAGDAQTYDVTHPGAGTGAFDSVTSGLRDLAAVRRRLGRPLIKVYHVISKANSGGLETMVRHALDVDADQVEFQVIDLVPDTAADLALGPAEVDEIEGALKRLRSWPEFTTHWLEKPHLRPDAPPVVWQEFDDFGRFLRLGALDGFRHLEGPHLRCPRGLTDEAMRKIDNDVFELSFPRRVCNACSRARRCFPGGVIGTLHIPTLKLTGAGSFLRRARAAVSDPGEVEAELVRVIPCVVGDLYSRIDHRGNVVACCKGSSAPLGNVVDSTFLSVWSSPRYETFRHNARNLPKNDPYFAPFGCLQSCDNLGMNLHALYTVDGKPENADDSR